MGHPRLSPRSTRCRVCRDVRELADVNLRLFDEDGGRLEAGTWRVAEYLSSIGVAGTKRALNKRAMIHRDHMERHSRGERVAVVLEPNDPGGVTRLAPPMGPARWLDVNQDAMDGGRGAILKLNQKLEEGTLEPNQLVALAKLGLAAAGKRADIEAKGRRLNQMDELLHLAAGMRPRQIKSPGT